MKQNDVIISTYSDGRFLIIDLIRVAEGRIKLTSRTFTILSDMEKKAIEIIEQLNLYLKSVTLTLTDKHKILASACCMEDELNEYIRNYRLEVSLARDYMLNNLYSHWRHI